MKNRFGMETFLLEGEPLSALGGGAPDPTPAPGEPTPDPTPGDSIYGDLDVKFPEGFDNTLREEPSLKAFVDRESGELNYSNLMKSYVHAQKQVGSNKAVLPNENSSPEELDAFYEKLGYKPNEEDYQINKAEESQLSDERLKEVKAFARENRMPVAQAQKLVSMLEGNITNDSKAATDATVAHIETELNGLKTEWGQAYDTKLAVASRVLNEVVADEAITAVFADPRIGSNPAVIKMLNSIGEKLFKEDGFKGDSNNGALSPDEASVAINEIMSDKDGAYWKKGHPSHGDVVKKVNDLFKMKQGR